MAAEEVGAIGQDKEGIRLPYSCKTKGSPSPVTSSHLLQPFVPGIEHGVPSCGSRPFFGLVICVTGLSKEAREQVMEATDKLGGRYSPTLLPECTHLVVQSFGGWKLEHILKHGFRNRLFVVTLGWFVDSVRKNVGTNFAYIALLSQKLLLPERNHQINGLSRCKNIVV